MNNSGEATIQDMAPRAAGANGSYRRILKSTTIIGGSAVINICFRVIRTKVTAILLGRSGIGLLGTYTSLTETIGALVGLGLDTGGVRQIAEASGTRDDEKIARTIFSLRRLVRFLGLFGMIALMLLSIPFSRLTFKSSEYASDIMLLSVTILFMTVMNGEVALIQGLQRIGDLGRLNILSALFGTVLSVPILYLWGRKGIVPFLVAGSAMSLLSTWWYAKQVKVRHVEMSWTEIRIEARPMLKLGLAIMTTALMTRSTMYLLNVVVARRLGLEAVGLYQAAVILSFISVGFILDAMVKDYLPRLTAVSNDDVACNRLINEQVEIGVLLSAPGIMATLTFAPLIIHYLYSAEFMPAFEILRWQILGVLLQVVSWPVGFILQAKGRGSLIIVTEFLSSLVHVGLIYVGIAIFGLNGTGMAFLGMRAFFGIMMYGVARYLTGFTWSATNMRLAMLVAPLMVINVMSGLSLNLLSHLILGSALSAALALYSINRVFLAVGPGAFGLLLAKIRDR